MTGGLGWNWIRSFDQRLGAIEIGMCEGGVS